MNPERPEATYIAKKIIKRFDLNIFPNHMASAILDGFQEFRGTKNVQIANKEEAHGQ